MPGVRHSPPAPRARRQAGLPAMHVLALVASVGQVLDDEVDVFVYEQIEHGAAPVESTIDWMRAQKPESLAVIPPERRHAASAPGLHFGGL